MKTDTKMSKHSLQSSHSSDEISVGREIDETLSDSSETSFTRGQDDTVYTHADYFASFSKIDVETHSETCSGTEAIDRNLTDGTKSFTSTRTDRDVSEFNMQTEYCQQHKDRLKDMFCKQHDVFVCSTCVDLQHR